MKNQDSEIFKELILGLKELLRTCSQVDIEK